MHRPLAIANQEMARIFTGKPAIHRERIERVEQRCDLLTETHIEANGPRQGHIPEDAEYSETELVGADG